MAVKPHFSGKWVFHDQENFEAFLSENGVPWLIRKAAGFSKPTCVIEQNGDEFHIQMMTTMKTIDDKFTVGTDFEQTQPNGAVFVVSTAWEGDALVSRLAPKEGSSGKNQIQKRYLENDLLILELEIGDVKAKRRFTREQLPAPQ